MQDAHACTMYTLNIDSFFITYNIHTCTHHVMQGSASCRLVSPSIITCPPSNTHRAGRRVGCTHLGQHSPWGVTSSCPNRQTVLGQVVRRQRRTPRSQKLEECIQCKCKEQHPGLHAVELGVHDVGIQKDVHETWCIVMS